MVEWRVGQGAGLESSKLEDSQQTLQAVEHHRAARGMSGAETIVQQQDVAALQALSQAVDHLSRIPFVGIETAPCPGNQGQAEVVQEFPEQRILDAGRGPKPAGLVSRQVEEHLLGIDDLPRLPSAP